MILSKHYADVAPPPHRVLAAMIGFKQKKRGKIGDLMQMFAGGGGKIKHGR